jgi:hypothetical protein
VLPEGDDRGVVDGKNAKSVGPDLRGIFHQPGAPKLPHTLGIGCRLRRTLINEPKHRVLAHLRELFLSSCSASAGRR